MRDYGQVGKDPGPGGRVISADPFGHPKQQAYAKGHGARYDLILRQSRDEGSDRQKRAGLQEQPQIPDRKRLPVGVTVLEQKYEVKSGKEKQTGIQKERSQPLSNNDFHI